MKTARQIIDLFTSIIGPGFECRPMRLDGVTYIIVNDQMFQHAYRASDIDEWCEGNGEFYWEEAKASRMGDSEGESPYNEFCIACEPVVDSSVARKAFSMGHVICKTNSQPVLSETEQDEVTYPDEAVGISRVLIEARFNGFELRTPQMVTALRVEHNFNPDVDEALRSLFAGETAVASVGGGTTPTHTFRISPVPAPQKDRCPKCGSMEKEVQCCGDMYAYCECGAKFWYSEFWNLIRSTSFRLSGADEGVYTGTQMLDRDDCSREMQEGLRLLALSEKSEVDIVARPGIPLTITLA